MVTSPRSRAQDKRGRREDRGRAERRAERAFTVALQKKNALQNRVSPSRFRSVGGQEETAARCWGAGGDRRPGQLGEAAWPAAVPGGWAAGAGWAIPGQARARRGRARPGLGRRLLPGCRAALGPQSVCWQEVPAHAVLVNIQTRDFSQSKSTSTFFENLPKNSKRREFLAPSLCRRRSKFATEEVWGKGVIVNFFSSGLDIMRFLRGGWGRQRGKP